MILAKLLKTREQIRRKRQDDEEKPFLEHLEDLRNMLLKMIVTLLVTTLVCFIFHKQLVEVMQVPFELSKQHVDDTVDILTLKMGVFQPQEGLMLSLKLAMYSGIVLSFPLLMYFLAEFVLPGLHANEKKLVLPSVGIGFGLFLGGVAFAFFIVMPRVLAFFAEWNADLGLENDWRMGWYAGLVTQMTLIFGLAFELPVVVMAFYKLGILTHGMMRSTRNHAIVIIIVISAVVTPTTDILTLSFLAIPMILLYELCIWLTWFLERKEREIQRQKDAEYDAWTKKKNAESSDISSATTTGEAEVEISDSDQKVTPEAFHEESPAEHLKHSPKEEDDWHHDHDKDDLDPNHFDGDHYEDSHYDHGYHEDYDHDFHGDPPTPKAASGIQPAAPYSAHGQTTRAMDIEITEIVIAQLGEIKASVRRLESQFETHLNASHPDALELIDELRTTREAAERIEFVQVRGPSRAFTIWTEPNGINPAISAHNSETGSTDSDSE